MNSRLTYQNEANFIFLINKQMLFEILDDFSYGRSLLIYAFDSASIWVYDCVFIIALFAGRKGNECKALENPLLVSCKLLKDNIDI